MEKKKRLMRSKKDRVIGGVCGGIANYLDHDPTFVRIAYILFSIFTIFGGLFAYIIIWMIMPKERIE